MRLNITLYNFAATAETDGALSPESSVCYEVGPIKEGDASKTVLVCGGDPRQKVVHISNGGPVEVSFVDKSVLNTLGHFLIHYEGQSRAPFILHHDIGKLNTSNITNALFFSLQRSVALTRLSHTTHMFDRMALAEWSFGATTQIKHGRSTALTGSGQGVRSTALTVGVLQIFLRLQSAI